MNKKVFLALPLAALALVGCNSAKTSSESTSTETYQMKWVSPIGTPTIAFYDQGGNQNWVTTSDPANVVVPAFKAGSMDAIVFDGVGGLGVLAKSKSTSYKLASWISEGNFYVVSTKHASGEAFKTGETIQGFVPTGNAARAFLKLSADKWGWSYAASDITWVGGVAAVGQVLSQSPASYDYYLVAEPTLTIAQAALAKQNITLNVVYDLQAEWKKAYNGNIPAAALFVNVANYTANQEVFTTFIANAQTRIDTAISTPSAVKTALNAYGNDAAVSQRFGYTASIAVSLQNNHMNKFGLLQSGSVSDKVSFANNFQTALGGAAFDTSLFLS